MSWMDIVKTVGKVAPIAGTLLGGPLGGSVGGMISSVLGVENTPEAVATALKDPAQVLELKKFEIEHKSELVRLNLEAETKQLSEVNQTIRAEAASSDPYVRRWRPTFGYCVAGAWTLQVLGIIFAVIWAVIAAPEKASEVINAIGALCGALTASWAVALAVLGVNVHKRSKDKETAAGTPAPAGILSTIVNAIGSN